MIKEKMVDRHFLTFGCYFLLLVIYQPHNQVEAGPMKRLSRTIREVYPEIEPEVEGSQAQVCIVGDVVYAVDEPVPAEQPCLKCKCQPPGVQCETIRCQKKPGCKAIHKPNKCCPDYQCECEFNGRAYANGEKLDPSPGGECKACYCRGGEIQCTEVSCYIRNDCQGRKVPGQCCPKFDHCPPIDALPDRSLNATDITLSNIEQQILENWPLTPPPSTNQDDNKIPETFDEVTSDKLPKTTEIEIDNLEIDNKPLTRITIHEIIPDIKEIPITEEEEKEEKEESITEQKSDNDLVVDTEPDSSEVKEVIHQPPPVLKVGDKLIYLKNDRVNSTPSSVITVVGAEGLQRGDDSNESHEKNDVPLVGTPSNDLELQPEESTHILSLVKKKKPTVTSTSTTTESSESATAGSSTLKEIVSESTTEVSTVATEITTSIDEGNTTENSKMIELASTTSSDIFSTRIDNESSTQMTEISTESDLQNSTMESSTKSEVTESLSDFSTPSSMIFVTETILASSAAPESKEALLHTDIASSTTEEATLSTLIESTTLSIVKEDVNASKSEAIKEENDPKDILSTTPTVEPVIETSTPAKIEKEPVLQSTISEANLNSSKILPDVLEIRNNKTIPENTTNSEWLKKESLMNYQGALPDSLLNSKSPIDDETTTIFTTEGSTTEIPTTTEFNLDHSRSVESLESNEESGESTTKKSKESMIKSESTENENASIEASKIDQEAIDMVAPAQTTKDPLIPITGDEERKNGSQIHLEDVEMINITSNNNNPANKENPEIAEPLPKPEKLILKRANSVDDEAAAVFKQLNDELLADQTERMITKEEEEKEADAIFRELLEETSTKKPPKVAQSKEEEALQRVSDAIAQLTLRGKTPDANILGVLANFFTSQYKYYDNNK